MAEPARKFSEIEPDIRPNLRVLEGGGESTSERGNLKAVNNDSIEDAKNAEESANQGWENKYTGERQDLEAKLEERRQLGRGYRALGKNPLLARMARKGPLTTIIFTVVGGGIGLSTFFSPGLLIVHMKETMVDKFNAQLASMEVRSNKLLSIKKGTVGGLLCKSLNRCRYNTMSAKQIAKFEEAGIKVRSVDAPFGRKTPTGFDFEDMENIKANELASKMSENPRLGSAYRKATNSKFAGFVDSIWEKISAKWSISKAATEIAGETEDASLKNVQKATSTPELEAKTRPGSSHEAPTEELNDDGTIKTVGDGKNPQVDANEGPWNETTEQGNAVAENVNKDANAIAEGTAEKAGAQATREAGEALLEESLSEGTSSFARSAMKIGANKLASGVKVTGIMDDACTVYRSIQALGYAAKVVRALQLARFAMLFLNVADQIKAGAANPDDVSYLGKILTTEFAATLADMKYKSATDSFGYKFAAYNERGKMSNTAMQFLAGGGLPGDIIGLTTAINSVLLGMPKKTCKLLGNVFVGIGSAVAGIALIPLNGPVQIGAKVAWGALKTIAFQVGMMLIPELLKDIVAGVLVDKTTFGEDAGDAYTSGASGLLGSMAQRGGNSPLRPTEALAYNNLTTNIIAQYAEDDRLAYSPFDITNRNTFLSKIFTQLIPYATNMSSLPGILTSIASMPVRSLAMVTSNNAMAIDVVENYTMCPDLDYNNLTDVQDGTGDKVQLATDPFCNVMYGIPPTQLDTDPIEIVDALEMSGDIDLESGKIVDGSKYQTFFNDCIARDRPLGDMGADFQRTDGSECLFNDTNKNYYLYYIDQRVLSSLDDEQMEIDPGIITHIDKERPGPITYESKGTKVDISAITKDQLYGDSSGTACYPPTTDAGNIPGTDKDGKAIIIKLCAIPNTKVFVDGGGEVKVNSLVSQAWYEFVEAMRYERAITTFYAKDNYSLAQDLPEEGMAMDQHKFFLALNIDIANMEPDNATAPSHDWFYSPWLADNAYRFGMQRGSEGWHWAPANSF